VVAVKVEPKPEQTPILALRKTQAAAALNVSDEFFDKHVVPRVRCVRLGSLRLYPVSELQAFLDGEARLPLEGR
jgi:hypothetical protein